MGTHTIEPSRATLHGVFSRDLPPVLAVDPGETVVFRTLDAGWGLEPPTAPGAGRRRFADARPEWRGDGHPLCGPVAVRGAEPGMVLEVRIGEVRPARWGWTYAGGPYSDLNRRLGVAEREELLVWDLDPDRLVGRDQHGHAVALRPFLGIIGLPPAAPGRHPTRPPRPTGGNLDCKELVAGSALFLPVAVPGGLLSVGDGHAAQGDGEVGGQAIECPMERVELTLLLHEAPPLATPRARTPAGWLTFGFDRDPNEATAVAVAAMLDLLGELVGADRHTALALASVAVDLRVTQVVNELWGAHALLPHGAIR
jgi:acetamidase/formamidase